MKKYVACALTAAMLLTGCAGIGDDGSTEPTVVTTVTPAETTQPTETTIPETTDPKETNETISTEPISAGNAMVRVYPAGDSFQTLAAAWLPEEVEGYETVPMKLATSVEELRELVEGLGYDSLAEAMGAYDERFFSVYDLALIPVTATTGMAKFDYTIQEEGNVRNIQVEPVPLDPNALVTTDMLYAFLLVPVERRDEDSPNVIATGHTGMTTGNSGLEAY